MGRDLDLVEENLITVGGEISAEQVVAVDEKLCIHKETALDVSCILLLLFFLMEGCLHLNHCLLSQETPCLVLCYLLLFYHNSLSQLIWVLQDPNQCLTNSNLLSMLLLST